MAAGKPSKNTHTKSGDWPIVTRCPESSSVSRSSSAKAPNRTLLESLAYHLLFPDMPDQAMAGSHVEHHKAKYPGDPHRYRGRCSAVLQVVGKRGDDEATFGPLGPTRSETGDGRRAELASRGKILEGQVGKRKEGRNGRPHGTLIRGSRPTRWQAWQPWQGGILPELRIGLWGLSGTVAGRERRS